MRIMVLHKEHCHCRERKFQRNFRPLLPMTKNIAHGNMADIEQITEQTAAVIIEIIGGEAACTYSRVFSSIKEKMR
jgi:acetylornithine/succinyldiaminopimelate/putrescine aminotransferase